MPGACAPPARLSSFFPAPHGIGEMQPPHRGLDKVHPKRRPVTPPPTGAKTRSGSGVIRWAGRPVSTCRPSVIGGGQAVSDPEHESRAGPLR